MPAAGTTLSVGSHKATIEKFLMEGGFSKIYQVRMEPKEDGTDIGCLKRVIVTEKAGLNALRKEVEVMKTLSWASHIVRYYDSHAERLPDGSYQVLVLMELCPNKSLLDFMNDRIRTKLSESEILKILLDISLALYEMHKIKLVHRDVKIENVLIDANHTFKLCDFGSVLAPIMPPKNQQEFQLLSNDILYQTTPQYRSPEMVDLYRGLPIDEKCDIWALGCFLYKLCYYTTPFEAHGDIAILHASFQFLPQPVYSGDLKNLIIIMLQENPLYRPNIVQILMLVSRMLGKNIEDYSVEDFYNAGPYNFQALHEMQQRKQDELMKQQQYYFEQQKQKNEYEFHKRQQLQQQKLSRFAPEAMLPAVSGVKRLSSNNSPSALSEHSQHPQTPLPATGTPVQAAAQLAQAPAQAPTQAQAPAPVQAPSAQLATPYSVEQQNNPFPIPEPAENSDDDSKELEEDLEDIAKMADAEERFPLLDALDEQKNVATGGSLAKLEMSRKKSGSSFEHELTSPEIRAAKSLNPSLVDLPQDLEQVKLRHSSIGKPLEFELKEAWEKKVQSLKIDKNAEQLLDDIFASKTAEKVERAPIVLASTGEPQKPHQLPVVTSKTGVEPKDYPQVDLQRIRLVEPEQQKVSQDFFNYGDGFARPPQVPLALFSQQPQEKPPLKQLSYSVGSVLKELNPWGDLLQRSSINSVNQEPQSSRGSQDVSRAQGSQDIPARGSQEIPVSAHQEIPRRHGSQEIPRSKHGSQEIPRSAHGSQDIPRSAHQDIPRCTHGSQDSNARISSGSAPLASQDLSLPNKLSHLSLYDDRKPSEDLIQLEVGLQSLSSEEEAPPRPPHPNRYEEVSLLDMDLEKEKEKKEKEKPNFKKRVPLGSAPINVKEEVIDFESDDENQKSEMNRVAIRNSLRKSRKLSDYKRSDSTHSDSRKRLSFFGDSQKS